ncbi:zinc finger protein 200-like [Clinocottus analis]|uniref:zinc finger protein 200-like n=1 Tax=Clinocottus analis TaxID=304258 RepID=UPI0035BF0181
MKKALKAMKDGAEEVEPSEVAEPEVEPIEPEEPEAEVAMQEVEPEEPEDTEVPGPSNVFKGTGRGCTMRRLKLPKSIDVQQLLEITAEVPPECLDLDQEDPEPLHIKEEPEPLHIKEEPEPLHIKEEPEPLHIKKDPEPRHIKKDPEPLHIKEEQADLWIRLEGEQLVVLEDADITKFLSTAVTVKSEDDKLQTSQLHQSQTEDNREAEPPTHRPETPVKTETEGEDCGGSGPSRNLNPHCSSHPNADDEKASEASETELLNGDWREPLSDSGPESEDSDNVWKETRAPESIAHVLKYNEGLVSHVGCNTERFYYKELLQKNMCNFGKMSSGCLEGNKCFSLVKQKNESQPRLLTRNKPFSCDVCGKRFTRKGYLKRHMTVHIINKPFSCDECGKRFVEQRYLKRHMIVHMIERPFNCDGCRKRFKLQGNLKKHMRVHRLYD